MFAGAHRTFLCLPPFSFYIFLDVFDGVDIGPVHDTHFVVNYINMTRVMYSSSPLFSLFPPFFFLSGLSV